MASEHARAELRREQALLRNRVHRNLAACGGETLAVAQSAPSKQPGWNPPQGGGGGAHYPQYPQGAAPVAARAPQDPSLAETAHTQLQRQLLFFLAQDGASLALPLRPDKLLHLTCDRYPELKQFERELSPGNVERALSELHALMPRAVRLDRYELVGLDVAVLTEFKRQLVRGMGGNADAADSRAPPVPASSSTRKRAASQAQDDELMEVMSLVDKKSIKQQEKQKGADELLELINKPSAKQAIETSRFRTEGGSKLKEFCRHGTKDDCARFNGTGVPCALIHFRRIIQAHTDVSLGDCSYLDTCRHMRTCKFIHYEVDADDAQRMRQGATQLDPFARVASNATSHDQFSRHYGPQFINCDIRTFPLEVLGKFPVIMADPPWDIHMELPYGTMSDDEMRRMNVQVLQDDGVIFLWVTGRAMELGRECLDIWGYTFVQELLWVKTNQLQRIIRTGRTGHWINHSKEHCLIGVKGKPQLNNNLDCDVVCAEISFRQVRETSRKPDEMYHLLERLAPGVRKVEIFGRPHNVHKGWTTLGNQLGKSQICEPWLRERVLADGVFEEDDLAPLPTPPDDPIVPPWGGHPPPPALNLRGNN